MEINSLELPQGEKGRKTADDFDSCYCLLWLCHYAGQIGSRGEVCDVCRPDVAHIRCFSPLHPFPHCGEHLGHDQGEFYPTAAKSLEKKILIIKMRGKNHG